MEINQWTIILSYFLIYSFLGWVLESVYKSLLTRKIVNSGFITGPFCPIYGFGAVILYIFLDGFKSNLVLVFVISLVVFTIWEFLVGYFLEKVFNTKYWDYSNEKFNWCGRICLHMSLVWGLLGVFFIYVLHPVISKAVQQLPQDMLIPVLAVVLLALIVDFIVSGIKVKNIEINLSKLKEIQENLNTKLAEIKSLQNVKAISNKKLQNVKAISNKKLQDLKSLSSQKLQLQSLKKNVEELKQAERLLKYKINKRIVRLRKAFPTMKSQVITEFLNQKIEVIKKDKKER